MDEPLPLRLKGRPVGLSRRELARVTRHQVPIQERHDCFLLLDREYDLRALDLDGYVAILCGTDVVLESSNVAIIQAVSGIENLTDGTVLAANPDGSIFLLFRPESPNNAVFTTSLCNSNCLMCSQPPRSDDIEHMAKEQLRLIELIDRPPELLGITGGEPTLLGDSLVRILEGISRKMPETHVHMLTNGRRYSDTSLVEKIAAAVNPLFLSTIPLYADNASDHDYVVQAKGAFDETIMGFYNAAEAGLRTEIRVVLHKQTIPRLTHLMEFIYRNLPFVEHVALMGLENMGYVKKNWNELWVDPIDYQDELASAVRHLYLRGVAVSLYNLQLCVIPPSLWPFARQSISDYKNIFLDVCGKCGFQGLCGGLFKSSEKSHSRGIRALRHDEVVG